MLCPRCHRAYDSLLSRFCPEDGAPLIDAPPLRPTEMRPTRQRGAVLEGRYVILGLIGEGGMSRVYLAEVATTKERVAVKILNYDMSRDSFTRECFLKEVEVAAQLNHPHIARVLDAGERRDGSPFLVLEFLRGESLGQLLRREKIVPLPFALPLLRMAASALSAAHAAGIIHRDVKPDNMFLCREGDGPYLLKVMDFGMAKLKEGPTTMTGLTLGTVPFMAPEQALGDALDGRTDVYGFGIMMYRMLAGRVPFDSADDTLTLAQHLFVAPQPIGELVEGIDPLMEKVVMTALRKAPENRYPSMLALLEDIEHLMGIRPGPPIGVEINKVVDEYEPINPLAQSAARYLRGLLHPPA